MVELTTKRLELTVEILQRNGFHKSHIKFKDIDMWYCFLREIDSLNSQIEELEKQLQHEKCKCNHYTQGGYRYNG